MGIFNKMKYYVSNIAVTKFVYLNYFSRKIQRIGKGRLIPYKGTVLNFKRDARIILYDKDVILGVNRLRGSHAETLVRLDENAIWECTGEASITYGTTIDVKANALLKTGRLFINTGTVIVAEKKITIGEGSFFGRNVIIYDSDFHDILDENLNIKNPPNEVVIGEKVWLTNNITVLKGVNIANGVVVSPYAVVRKSITEENCMVGGLDSKNIIQNDVRWRP